MNSNIALFRKAFIIGLGLSMGIATTLLVGGTISGTMHTFIIGQPISSSQINENFETLRNSIIAIQDVPRGSIIAWHKSLTGTPNLPDGWVECNGQTISDSDSVYNGQIVPNLNGQFQSYHSRGVFLRGGVSSGTFEDDQFQGHVHGDRVNSSTVQLAAGGAFGGSDWTFPPNTSFPTGPPVSDGTNGTPRTGMETRPVNMSVVWIIRIK